MGWFFSAPKAAAEMPPERLDIPLFPLKAVLFPGGCMGLKIFEQRYLDMASNCLKDGSAFGVCLIVEGGEVGAPAVPHAVGTLATIDSWDMPQLGILNVTVRGGRRFSLRSQRVEAGGLLRGEAELSPPRAATAIGEAHAGLVNLLRTIAVEAGAERMPEPHAFDDAEWVGHRLTEVLPVKLLAKQKLLELDDPTSRLEILFSYLAQRGLVK
jgi:Lon protease-like protein